MHAVNFKSSDKTVEWRVDDGDDGLILGDILPLCIGCNLIILFLE